LCERVCPILKKQAPQPTEVKAYAAYAAEDALRAQSSSGGLFTLLAEEILSRGGYVAGAAFDEDLSVRHILVDNVRDLEKLRGSKYVQSRMEDTYLCVKEQLQKGRPVLFTGVSCQVAGLKAYLGKEYENLYTVDVLCHGVPSPKVWEQYLREQEADHREKPAAVSFRDKRTGWRRSSISVKFADGAEYCRPGEENRYMQLFLRDICLRPSCHSCRFKSFPRLSDLTIGDAWGIEKQMPELDDDRGISLVMINTPKGHRFLQNVKNCQVVPVAEEECMQPNLKAPAEDFGEQDVFWRTYRKYGFAAACKRMGYLEKNLPDKLLVLYLKVRDKLVCVLRK
jgi:coenzyme F420-reducing hydrogenase beta subunit